VGRVGRVVLLKEPYHLTRHDRGYDMPSKLRALRRGTALTRSERQELGPIQVVVLGFGDLKFEDQVLDELRRLSSLEVVRLVDAVLVAKSKSGEIVRVRASDPTQAESQLGAIAEALVGLGEEVGTIGDESEGADTDVEARGFLGDERTWSVAAVIPPGQMALVALIEHRWAIPARAAVSRAGGTILADAWLHPDDLAAYGAGGAGAEETDG
jgi:uncharacterized membrane protein